MNNSGQISLLLLSVLANQVCVRRTEEILICEHNVHHICCRLSIKGLGTHDHTHSCHVCFGLAGTDIMFTYEGLLTVEFCLQLHGYVVG